MRLLVERRDAGADDLDVVAEIARIGGRVEDADVGAIADEPQRGRPALAERDVEVGAEESGVAALLDDAVLGRGRELREISAPFVPAMACAGNILNSASSVRWLSVR